MDDVSSFLGVRLSSSLLESFVMNSTSRSDRTHFACSATQTYKIIPGVLDVFTLTVKGLTHIVKEHINHPLEDV